MKWHIKVSKNKKIVKVINEPITNTDKFKQIKAILKKHKLDTDYKLVYENEEELDITTYIKDDGDLRDSIDYFGMSTLDEFTYIAIEKKKDEKKSDNKIKIEKVNKNIDEKKHDSDGDDDDDKFQFRKLISPVKGPGLPSTNNIVDIIVGLLLTGFLTSVLTMFFPKIISLGISLIVIYPYNLKEFAKLKQEYLASKKQGDDDDEKKTDSI